MCALLLCAPFSVLLQLRLITLDPLTERSLCYLGQCPTFHFLLDALTWSETLLNMLKRSAGVIVSTTELPVPLGELRNCVPAGLYSLQQTTISSTLRCHTTLKFRSAGRLEFGTNIFDGPYGYGYNPMGTQFLSSPSGACGRVSRLVGGMGIKVLCQCQLLSETYTQLRHISFNRAANVLLGTALVLVIP